MNKIKKSASAIARAIRFVARFPGFRVFHSGGQIIRNPRKIRSLAVEFEGRTIILRGKSLRRHRIKMKRIEREAAKAGA